MICFADARSHQYIGSNTSSRGVPDEYVKYLSQPDIGSASQFDLETVEEAKRSLGGLALDSDNVKGIRQVSGLI